MRIRNFVISMVLIYLLTILPAFAAKQWQIKCPSQIQVNQSASTTYSGWRTLQPTANHYLNGVMFYSGKPEEMASLKPEKMTQTQSTWIFSPTDQIYIVCEYDKTSLQLTQLLPGKVTECTVRYDASIRGSHGEFIPDQIQCKSTNVI